MSDILKYRFPGESAVELMGSFFPLDELANYNGFVVSDFAKQHLFGFNIEALAEIEIDNSKEPFVISKEAYLKEASLFLDELEKQSLGKAVFSRIKNVPFNAMIQNRLFEALCEAYPKAFVYEVKGHEFGHWIGATPEILLSGNDQNLNTVALASTKLKEDDTPWSEKELKEQALVSEFIEGKLKELNVAFQKSEREEVIAGPVKHLANYFALSEVTNISEVVMTLHPTPAVSGLPRNEALKLINEHESHDRGLYAGFLGLIGSQNKLYVNLRCAQLIDDQAFLYLGGGFTKESYVESEWEETENKAKTLLKVIENL